MSGQNQQSASYQATQQPTSYQSNTESDTQELFQILWKKKLIIVVSTFIFSFCSIVYSVSQRDLYESQSSLLLEDNFYNTTGISEPYFTPEFFESRSLKDSLHTYANISESELDTVSFSFKVSKSRLDGVESGIITVTALSTDSQLAVDIVTKVSSVLNKVMKKRELYRVSLSIKQLNNQSKSSYSSTTKNIWTKFWLNNYLKKQFWTAPSLISYKWLAYPLSQVLV